MIRRSSYHGNPYIGLFIEVSESFSLFPTDVNKKLRSAVIETLNVEPIYINIAESNLNGAYAVALEDMVLLPSICSEEEVKILKEKGIDVFLVNTKFNALNNNIVIGKKGGLINPRMEKEVKKSIEDALGIELEARRIANYSTVGSVVYATNKGFLMTYKASDEEFKLVEDILGLEGERTSLNMGTQFISLSILANSKGAVVGELTTGIELARVEQGLGFV